MLHACNFTQKGFWTFSRILQNTFGWLFLLKKMSPQRLACFCSYLSSFPFFISYVFLR